MVIRPFKNGDEENIRSLFKICFGRDMTSEEWLWKYKNSYLGSSSAVAEVGGKIIAHYGGIKMNFYYQRNILKAYQGCDAMTHPEYRSRGIIVKTAKVFYEVHSGMDFMFGFPSEAHANISARHLGWQKHEFINEMSKEINIIQPQKSNWKVETGWGNIRDKELDAFWNNIKDLKDFSVEKKSDYIFWRYRDNPCQQYELVLFKGPFTRVLKAYAVVQKKGGELRVLDMLVSEAQKIKKVISFVEKMAAERKTNRIRLWVNPYNAEYNILKEMGYKEEKGIPYALKLFEASIFSPASFLERYNYSMGDYDAA